MIDRLPSEIFSRVTSQISQADKVSLTYVSHGTYKLAVRSLYENIYLNDRYYFPSDLDDSLGTHFWSVLSFPYVEDDQADVDGKLAKSSEYKFKCLVRSLKESPKKLAPLIRRVHLTWHYNWSTMVEFLEILDHHDPNLIEFENFINSAITPYLWKHAPTLQSLDLVAPTILPAQGTIDAEYFVSLRTNLTKYNLGSISNLTLHVNPLSFFHKWQTKLKIRDLSLNIRNEMLRAEPVDPDVHYYDIFDIDTLTRLEICSWYGSENPDLDLVELWQLNDFWKFENIEVLSLLSLFANEPFLRGCISSFKTLRKLRVDFMFDFPISQELIALMGRSSCAETIEYIDIKFKQLGEPLIETRDETGNAAHFELALTCRCDDCNNTFHNIILKKYFPDRKSLTITEMSNDVLERHFLLQLLEYFPIVPYASFYDEYPSIGYYSKPLEKHVEKINALLGLSGGNALTDRDIVEVYHTYIHSLKQTFNFFLQNFRNLEYLVLNYLPTKVRRYDEQQRYNVPLFYSEGFKSNQIYEALDAEALFS